MAAAVPALLYLLYVYHYATNVPLIDDWSTISAAARPHTQTVAVMWGQYFGTRLFVPRVIFMGFASLDHLNLRNIILLGALLLVLSYAAILAMLRPLTVWMALAVGVVWFSLADSQNALWSFQLAWYLVVFFFVSMLCALLAPQHQHLFRALGIGAAVAASCSSIQGFAVWPVGLICLFWVGASRRWLVAWVAAALVTTLLYLRGFNTGVYVSCPAHSSVCGLAYSVTHPVQLARYLLLLMGSVYNGHGDLLVAEAIGIAVLALAGFVLVRSIREHGQPVSVLLIAFGLCFDLIIALGRVGSGPADALRQSRYTMANLILLAGIVVYISDHLRNLRSTFKLVGVGACAALLTIQCVNTTQAGLAAGRVTDQVETVEARILVNEGRLPKSQLYCDFAWAVYPSYGPNSLHWLPFLIHEMAQDQLSLFQPGTRKLYHDEGAPTQQAIYQSAVIFNVAKLWPSCQRP